MQIESAPPAANASDSEHPRTQAHDIAIALRNGAKLAGSLMVTWSVAMIVKLQVPAHLGPIRQGQFGFAESFAGMFFTTIGLGIDTYVMKEVSVRPKHASEFTGGVFALRILISIGLFGAMGATLWATGRPREIQLAVAVFGLIQLVMCCNSTLSAILQATTHVGRLAIANVAAKVIWGAGMLWGLHRGVPLNVLALPLLAAELLRTAVLLPAARNAADLRYRIDLRALRVVLLASVPFFVSGMAVGLGNNLAMSALEFIRKDEREVGWFGAIQNLSSLAMLLSPLLQWVVMPLLSRAHARSEEEMMTILRRAIEGMLVIIVPIMVLISVGSELWVKLAFGVKYLPAATGLSILSLVFVMTYLAMTLAGALVVLGKSWSVTLISAGAIVSMSGFMLVGVPFGRALFGTGGECAGAAMAVIANETCVVIAMLRRFRTPPLDGRNVAVLTKSLSIALLVIVLDRPMRGLGPARLVVDMTLYAALALATRVVRFDDVRRALRVMRPRRLDVPSAAVPRGS